MSARLLYTFEELLAFVAVRIFRAAQSLSHAQKRLALRRWRRTREIALLVCDGLALRQSEEEIAALEAALQA